MDLYCFHLHASVSMETVETPAIIMLDDMLKKLGLPCPKYKSHEDEEGQVVATIEFYPSVQQLHTCH
jgi:hypothetical protein